MCINVFCVCAGECVRCDLCGARVCVCVCVCARVCVLPCVHTMSDFVDGTLKCTGLREGQELPVVSSL